MVYTTWAKEDVSVHTCWKSFAGCWSIVGWFCSVWMNWVTNLPFCYLFAVFIVHCTCKKSHVQPAGGAKNQMTNLNLTRSRRGDKLKFDCCRTIWAWKWIVCIRISTDVLLLLFAQRCSPLLSRKSGDFWLFVDCDYQHFPEGFIDLFC